MKIVMITRFFSPHIGGVERHVLEVSRELAGSGNELHIITWRYDDRLPVFENMEDLKVHRILDSGWQDGMFRRLRGWAGTGSLWKVWRDAGAVHFHDYTPLLEWYLPFVTLNPRIFITFHGYEGYPIHRLSIYLRRFAGVMTKGAICVGAFIPKYYGTRCSKITYGGVSSSFPEHTTEKEGAVFVGGLRDDVGIRGYISSLAILKEKYGKRLKLTVVGDGPSREEVLRLAREKGVELAFCGLQDNPAPFLAHARVVFSDSYLAILEAMASRLPVFSFYDNPLKKDYLSCFPGNGALLAMRDDPDALALDLASFIDNPQDYEDRVEKGWLFAREETWAKVAGMYRDLYAS